MTLQEYIDEVKLELTGNLLHLEIPDETLGLVVKKALREVQRYIDSSKIMTIPFSRCIDLGEFKVSSVKKIYRVNGYLGEAASAEDNGNGISQFDPMWAAQWQILCGGGDMYQLSDWIMNYASWNTVLQIRNTTSTDLAFKYDKAGNKLYINSTFDTPTLITVEYVPVFSDVSEVTSDYWTDVILRLSVALTKQTLGRIRSKYKQSGALWETDGDTLLAEAATELQEIRDRLNVNDNLILPID